MRKASGPAWYPAQRIQWLNVRRVEFGRTAGATQYKQPIDMDVHDYLAAPRCTDHNSACQPFRFDVPDDWRELHYRVVFRSGEPDLVRRVVLK